MDVGPSSMEKVGIVNLRNWTQQSCFGFLTMILSFTVVTGCGSKFLKHQDESQLKQIDEFEQKVKIDIPADIDETPADTSAAATGSTESSAKSGGSADQSTANKTNDKAAASQIGAKDSKTKLEKASVKIDPSAAGGKSNVAVKGKNAAKSKAGKVVSLRRLPEIEPDSGFEGRRPIKDPFRVGEKVVHEVHYFNISAGTLAIEVKPFAQVNSKKNYHFKIGINTSRWYSGIYSVDDKVSVLMDFETLVPSVFQLHVRETGQLKEARMLFDGNRATYWEKKITDKRGVEEEKKDWDILDYSQNMFSAIYYMRVFDWKLGEEVAFRVADDGENLIFRGKAIRKEKISTDAGEFDTIVVQPQVELKGKFKPVGDIFIWLSDDDRKFILKIESKVKIGTLVSEVIELKP